jgi:hypothetical protein
MVCTRLPTIPPGDESRAIISLGVGEEGRGRARSLAPEFGIVGRSLFSLFLLSIMLILQPFLPLSSFLVRPTPMTRGGLEWVVLFALDFDVLFVFCG